MHNICIMCIHTHIHKKFWEELIAYLPSVPHYTHTKRCQQFFVGMETCLLSCYLATIGAYRQTNKLSFDKDRTENDTSNNSSTVALFVATGTCLPSRCLAKKGRIHFTERLPSNDRRDTHTDTQTDGRDLWSTPLRWAKVPLYIYVYTPGFMKIATGIQK
jgi:hypothetical protein